MKDMRNDLGLYDKITHFLNQNKGNHPQLEHILIAYLLFRFLFFSSVNHDSSYENYQQFIRSSLLNAIIPVMKESSTNKQIFEQLNEIFFNCRFNINENSEEKNEDKKLILEPIIFSKVFENIILKNTQGQKATGAFFTPHEIATRMSDLMINKFYSDKNLETVTILDPSCGGGEFLIASADILYNIYSDPSKDVVSIRSKIITSNLFGIDINPIAIQVTKIRLFLWKYSSIITRSSFLELLAYFETEFKQGKLMFNLFETNFFKLHGKRFDIIIGNPPYNIPIPLDIQEKISSESIKPIKNSAAYFMLLSYKLLSDTGILGFIMPKSLTYSKGWKSLKDFLLPKLLFLEDLNKGFKEVLLEQIIVIVRKNENKQEILSGLADTYENGVFEQKDYSMNRIYKQHCRQLDTLILGLTDIEYELFSHISEKVKDKLENHIIAKRGYNIQSNAELIQSFSINGEIDPNFIFCFGGKEIKQFALHPPKKGIKRELVYEIIEEEQGLMKKPRIIGQLANAHVLNPIPHYKLAFFLFDSINLEDRKSQEFKFLTFDTVINIFLKDNIMDNTYTSSKMSYLLLYLNSNLFAWYLYKIIYSSAIRSTRLDEIYLRKVPFLCDKNLEKAKEILIIFEWLSKSLSILSQFKILFINDTIKVDLKDIDMVIDKLDRFSNLIMSYIYLTGIDLFYNISFSTDLTTIIKEFQQFWRSIDYQKLIINTQVDEELKQLVKTTIYITNKVYNSVMDNLKENKILEKLHEFESSKKYEIIRAPFENKKNN